VRIIAHKIIEVFEVAGRTERMMPGLNALKPKTPKMYDVLKMSYDPKDIGFWQKKGLKLRANSHQITCWELAIELLIKIEKLEDRRLIWARAMRYSWVALARQFGCHRVTIKKKYTAAILNLEFSLDKSLIDKIDKLI
tara:strand:+ start:8999 stop:9412 length:414 start_codon:yes stop_codon:yes gene_type:complete